MSRYWTPTKKQVLDAHKGMVRDGLEARDVTVLGICYRLSEEGAWGIAWDEDLYDRKGEDAAIEDFYDRARDACDYEWVEGVLQEAGRTYLRHDPEDEPEDEPVDVAQVDVDVINRHRRGLGMAPLDVTQGWTGRELEEMAERIRTSGRMNNPRTEELKRRLMRGVT